MRASSSGAARLARSSSAISGRRGAGSAPITYGLKTFFSPMGSSARADNGNAKNAARIAAPAIDFREVIGFLPLDNVDHAAPINGPRRAAQAIRRVFRDCRPLTPAIGQ